MTRLLPWSLHVKVNRTLYWSVSWGRWDGLLGDVEGSTDSLRTVQAALVQMVHA